MSRKLVLLVVTIVLVVCAYVMTRDRHVDRQEQPEGEPSSTEVALQELDELASMPGVEAPTAQSAERTAVAEASIGDVSTATSANVLRVIIDGVSDEVAREATVALVVWDEAGIRVDGPRESWTCQGTTSEFDLDSLFAGVTARGKGIGSLVGNIDHPLHLKEPFSLAHSEGVVGASGTTVFEVRVTMAGTVFWPEFVLSVRDEETREHLEDVELHCIGTEFMNLRRQPGPGLPHSALGEGLRSPIALAGGHEAGQLDCVGAIALRRQPGEPPELVELAGRSENERGVIVYARAPGYEWGRINVDFSTSGERELLLGKGASLGVRLANVQLERYDELGTGATLFVYQSGWGMGLVRVEQLDLELEAQGLRLEGLEPGELTVSVELGQEWSRREREVLVNEKVTLVAGETRELLLALPDPPPPTERVTLGGVLAFPAFGGEKDVRLKLFHADWSSGGSGAELALADMEFAGGAHGGWAFRFEDVPVGTCQLHVDPLLKGWMIEVPSGGREDVELVIPELAEVFVESVDARTGKRVPLRELRYIYKEELPGRIYHSWGNQLRAKFEGEPGLFRFWMAPGPGYFGTWKIPPELGYAPSGRDLELVPGLQSLRLELSPSYSFRLELEVNGAAVPYDDPIYRDLKRTIHPVGHDGQVSYVHHKLAVVSAPGLYEITFDDIGGERFAPIPPRQVDVREGEVAEVVLQLKRK